MQQGSYCDPHSEDSGGPQLWSLYAGCREGSAPHLLLTYWKEQRNWMMQAGQGNMWLIPQQGRGSINWVSLSHQTQWPQWFQQPVSLVPSLLRGDARKVPKTWYRLSSARRLLGG